MEAPGTPFHRWDTMSRPAIAAPTPPVDGPRERLRALGVRALSLRELVALVVGAGGTAGSAADVAEAVLAAAGGDARGLARCPEAAFRRVPGVGTALAARLAAALELGRRSAASAGEERVRIRGPRDVHARMGPLLRDLVQEEFHALLLNAQHRLLRTVLITRGILDASLIHPREVFRPAVTEGAAAVILVHNHPSGDPSPSAEDRAVTRQLARAGRALGIPVLDHVVLGDGRFHALSEEGPLDCH
jgi:DNA repair protein RadC